MDAGHFSNYRFGPRALGSAQTNPTEPTANPRNIVIQSHNDATERSQTPPTRDGSTKMAVSAAPHRDYSNYSWTAYRPSQQQQQTLFTSTSRTTSPMSINSGYFGPRTMTPDYSSLVIVRTPQPTNDEPPQAMHHEDPRFVRPSDIFGAKHAPVSYSQGYTSGKDTTSSTTRASHGVEYTDSSHTKWKQGLILAGKEMTSKDLRTSSSGHTYACHNTGLHLTVGVAGGQVNATMSEKDAEFGKTNRSGNWKFTNVCDAFGNSATASSSKSETETGQITPIHSGIPLDPVIVRRERNKRPINAFMAFVSHMRILKRQEGVYFDNKLFLKEMGRKWKKSSFHVKRGYRALAQDLTESRDVERDIEGKGFILQVPVEMGQPASKGDIPNTFVWAPSGHGRHIHEKAYTKKIKKSST